MLKNMFNFLKKKPKTWIDQPVIDYLMGLNPLFVIYYTAKVGNRNIKFKFRDENGKFLADVHQKNVVSISLEYQGQYPAFYYPLFSRLDSKRLPRLKEIIDEEVSKYPTTQSHLALRQLREIQSQFKKQIEDTLQIRSYKDSDLPNENNDIHINYNSLDLEQRDQLTQFLNRLDSKCIDVTVTLHIDSATEEEICSTQTELDMYEMAQG